MLEDRTNKKRKIMNTHLQVIFLIFLLPFISSATKYQVINEARNFPGGARFESVIGSRYALQMMQTINFFIFDIFQQYSYADRKNVETVKLFIQQFDGGEGYIYGEYIHVSAIYLEGYQGDLKWEFTSLIHHEMAHVFQWDGEGKTPEGLVEGVADYMILKSSYYPPGYAKRGQGDRWDQGYDFTARFLEYCDMLRPGFVAELNKMMRFDYSDSYFQVLLGKSVDQLWADYKTMYPYHS